MSNVISLSPKSDFASPLSRAFAEVTKRGATLPRLAGAGLALMVAATPLLDKLAMKADAPSVRGAALAASETFSAKATPVGSVKTALRPGLVVKGVDSRYEL